MVREKACKNCRRIVEGDICPMCKSTDMTRSWRGTVVVFDAESEIAKGMNVKAAGRYVIEVK
ncbi:MAG: DNA-directed RNA polymerase subunit E'' [Candidatus Aenigmatarchaeota archaeon]|nr:MAG: DNA-directed RNA polymerase subunit E'' [Candidatus Aenigmarchaeota archaeon]